MPSTRSSADGGSARGPSRLILAIVVAVSLAVPAAILAVVLVRSSGSEARPAATASTVPTPRRAVVGSLAPDFAGRALDGSTWTLSRHRGRPVVLAFFASWCHPCEEELPALEQIARDHRGQVAVVGINYQDFASDTRDFVQRLHVTFPAIAEDSTENPIAVRYDVHQIPETLFVDRLGVVRARLYGETRRSDLLPPLDALLHS